MITSIKKIIKIYLDYGNNYSTNIFIHDFFLKKYKKVRTSHSGTNLRFFKRYSYNNDILGIEHSFLLRRENDEYFNFRIWAISYNNWLVLAISWFKPSKPINNSASGLATTAAQLNPSLKSRSRRVLSKLTKTSDLQNHLRYSL